MEENSIALHRLRQRVNVLDRLSSKGHLNIPRLREKAATVEADLNEAQRVTETLGHSEEAQALITLGIELAENVEEIYARISAAEASERTAQLEATERAAAIAERKAKLQAEREAAKMAAEQQAAKMAAEQQAAKMAAEQQQQAAKMAAEQQAAKMAAEQQQQAARLAAEERAAQLEASQRDAERKFQLDMERLRLEAAQQQAPPGTPQTEPAQRRESVLPRLNIPIFNGISSAWLNFRDLFTALVGENNSLNDAQKLQYLKNALRDQAAQLIANLPSTNANFEVAWKLLDERYNSPRDLVNSYIRRLLDLPTQKCENSDGLRGLVDSVREILRSLEILQRKEHLGQDIITVLISQKLDPETCKEWTLTFQNKSPPELDDLLRFMEKRAEALISAKPKGFTTPKSKPTENKRKDIPGGRQGSRGFTGTALAQKNKHCTFCDKNSHYINQCDAFLIKSPGQRKQWAVNNNRCFRCLYPTHLRNSCKSTYNCRVCQRKHHTLIHADEPAMQSKNPVQLHSTTVELTSHLNPETPPYNPSFTACNTTPVAEKPNLKETLLFTAQILVKGRDGRFYKSRAIVDSGSMSTLISERLARQLWLPRKSSQIQIVGVDQGIPTRNLGQVELTIKSNIDKEFNFTTEAIVLGRLASHLPLHKIERREWPHMKGLKLADPLYNTPSAIDVILGQDVFCEVMLPEMRVGRADEPKVVNSRLGWLLGGSVPVSTPTKSPRALVHYSIQHILKSFWEVDRLPDDDSTLSAADQWAEDHFLQTHRRLDDGSYEVRLPIVGNKETLGQSREIALSRLEAVERKLSKNPEMRRDYNDFMSEYEVLGHMREIDSSTHSQSRLYLPHHGVSKCDSLTTKLRVVFDAAAKTSTDVSLNSVLACGPVVQSELFDVLINFRAYKIALTTDIVKMYRSFHVNKLDTPLQSILWRKSPEERVKVFELNTVTYGLRSSSFLATRCLIQLARDERINFPLASEVLTKSTYIDDIITGGQSVSEVLQLREQLCGITASACLKLNKWSSNSDQVLASLPSEAIVLSPLSLDSDDVVKILGVIWLPNSDEFTFRAHSPSSSLPVTKRQMLGHLARLFDPLGLIVPVSVWAKIQIQKLWKLQSDWDSEVPTDIFISWQMFQEQLPLLTQVRIPRFIGESSQGNLSLFGFCDSSLSAYCACVYAQSARDGILVSSLVAARSRIAPLRTLSIPRLELCAALLLANLISRVSENLGVPNSKIRLFSDSQIVLSWLAAPARSWNMFVSNRVAQIQKLTDSVEWFYVPSANNPADTGTRGMLPYDLVSSSAKMWFNGPSFINDVNFDFRGLSVTPTTEVPERRKVVLVNTKEVNDISPVFKLERLSSSWVKLQRVTAYVFRFVTNAAARGGPRLGGPLSGEELMTAVFFHVRKAQAQCFHEDISALRSRGSILDRSSLRALTPFLDEFNILRVGGRLHHAPVPYEMKHPMILPRKGWLTELIINYVHVKRLHAGAALTLSLLRSCYWIIGGTATVKSVLRQCVTCARYRSVATGQLMGDLPPVRVWPNPAFSITGVDFCGPVLIRAAKGRRFPAAKAYIALFVCMSSKAVHLELVSGLSTQDFINAYKRFVSRRGLCKVLYSDRGTNFVGANHQLREMLRDAISSQAEWIQNKLREDGVEWRFIPAEAPHTGGLWESNVKQVKRLLVKTSKSQLWTVEQLSTLLCEIEAVLNSRPLLPLSNSPDELEAITPAHFIIGRHLSVIPSTVESHSPSGNNFRAIAQQLQQFWVRWSQEYLSTLMTRPKWQKVRDNVSIGDLVIVRDRINTPAYWRLGRVIGVLPGHDGLNRVVTIRTQNGLIQRSIRNVIVLFNENDKRVA